MNVIISYGNGQCFIKQNNNIRGVLIKYFGKISIIDKTPDGFFINEANNKIIIAPYGTKKTLSSLFDYTGTFKILYAEAADVDSKLVPIRIEKIMDYSQLLGVSESITVNSENLNKTNTHKLPKSITSLDKKIIANLHTKDLNIELYDIDGNIYNGKFHIHLADNNAMTGENHNESSIDLFYKNIRLDKLQPTKNKSLIPPSLSIKDKNNIKLKSKVTGGY
tara:strand:- start:1416 stop:2078 length:663 start_codon:yes stop_codon:yes gene_type:complete